MRSRTVTAALFVSLSLGAAACGSSSDSGSAASSTTPTTATSTTADPGSGTGSGTGSADDTAVADTAGDCAVDGDVRGDDTAKYIARPVKVSVTNAGPGAPPAYYESNQNLMKLSLYAEGDAPANVIWTTITESGTETTYTSSPSSTGLDIAADGSGGTVVTTLESADGKTVEMDITVSC